MIVITLFVVFSEASYSSSNICRQ